MNPSSPHSWHEANQQVLSAAIQTVRERLRHALQEDGAAPDTAVAWFAEAAAAIPTPSALDQLTTTFSLSSFERNLLLWCAGIELDASMGPLTARISGDPSVVHPTFGMALAVLPEAHWSALPPSSALRNWRLLDLTPGASLVTSPLRIDERILHFLTGTPHQDEHLQGFVKPIHAEKGNLVPSHQALVDRMVTLWSGPSSGKALPVIQLTGNEGAAHRMVASGACQALGLRLAMIRAEVLPSGPHEFDILVRLWEREAALMGSVLLLDATNIDTDLHRLARFVEDLRAPLVVSSTGNLRTTRTMVSLTVNRPSASEQRERWIQQLGTQALAMNGHIDRLTAQFDLGTSAIDAACIDARGRLDEAAPDHPHQISKALWNACRTQARPKLAHLGRRVEPIATWDDLVLPDQQYDVLQEIALQVKYRSQVYDRWGFAARSPRGLGISALFFGPSGTGKTLAAEVLAHALNLDLFHIDLSQVVSKYIGETEKNLGQVFDAAEQGGAVLLFDEADALFGKRTEVKDSHDRYANIEVSYLLQRMEAYRGLAILTTNMKGGIDEAFLRRIRFTVSFPFPKAGQRALIWQRIFPAETPTHDLAFDKLALLNVTGGHIRNIALSAAFLAADAGEPVRMSHLLQAAHTEYVKLEKPLTDHEIRGWI